jgi:hypothetical protein
MSRHGWTAVVAAACPADRVAGVVAGLGPGAVRVAVVVPAAVIVLFLGLLWVFGLVCDEKRRAYVVCISEQTMQVLGVLFAAGPGVRGGRGRNGGG